MRIAIAVVTFGLLTVAARTAGAQSANTSTPQAPAGLYRLDALLQRMTTCKTKPPSVVPAEIVLDGSGRYLDLIATQGRPAYWGQNVATVTFRNVPAGPHEGTLKDDLVLEFEEGTTKLSWPLPADAAVDLKRADLTSVARTGLVQMKVTRHGAPISTLWLIMRESNVILMDADGPIDPIYRSATVPGYMPCDFKLEYVPVPKDPPPPPVVAAPNLKTTEKPDPSAPTPLLPIQVPAEPGTMVDVHWKDIEYLKRGEDEAVQLVVSKNGRATSVLWITQKERSGFKALIHDTPAQKQAAAAGGGTGKTTSDDSLKLEVLLDRLGIASPAFLNRRRPAYIPATATKVELLFTSVASDRAYVVTFSGIPETERAELVRSGAQIDGCRDAKCQAVIRVPPGASAAIPLTALRNAYTKGSTGSTVTFDVAFYDEDTTPANSRGYLTFFDEPFFTESGSSTNWTGALSVNLLRDPDLTAMIPDGKKTVAITPANPLEHGNRTHVSGSATAGLKQNLGSRADFEVELTAKSGDFGQESSLKASKYLANIYTSYGATLTGGRLDVAAPTETIAFSESGDALSAGASVRRGFASVGYVFRKQSAADAFTLKKTQDAIDAGGVQLDRNNHDLVLQWRDISTGHFRSGVYGVVGDASRGRLRTKSDETKELVPFEASAWSAGAETNFTFDHTLISFGLYHSERSNQAPSDLKLASDDTEGNVGLLSYRYTNIDHDRVEGNQLATDFSITAQVGHGGKYVGENQAFTPDSLFLSKFAGLLMDAQGAIGAGLTNKWYYGFVATTPRIAPGKGVATLEVHHYRLNDPRAGSSNLGTEASIEFRLEQPKGIRYQLSFAGFQPGGALNTSDRSQALITTFQYSVKLGVTVRMQ